MKKVRDKLSYLNKDKPTITFCTGGIRCEKSSVFLENLGFKDVYQIEGGILNYFKECGNTPHYQGECFIFDKRNSLDINLKETGSI